MKTNQNHPRNPHIKNLRPNPSGLSRRRFLGRAGGLAAGVTLTGAWSTIPITTARNNAKKQLPNPVHSGVDHIVWVMMENRSFDHFLGWLPGAQAHQAGLAYPDRTGTLRSTYPLAPEYQGC